MDKKTFKSWWTSKNVLCTLEVSEIVKTLYRVCLGNIIEQSTEYFNNRPTWVKYILQNITEEVMRYNYLSTSHSCLFTNLSECLCWLYCSCLFIFSSWFLCLSANWTSWVVAHTHSHTPALFQKPCVLPHCLLPIAAF